MMEHPIKGLMTTAMENLKEMIDVNTIVGDPVETPDGGVILTVSKVGFGFATGGSEFSAGGDSYSMDSSDDESAGLPFGGGSGGGVSITPIAFLVVNSQGVNMLRLEQNTHLFEKMVDMAPVAFDKIQMMLKNTQSGQSNKRKSEEKQQLDYDI
ncbi:GerW family sporulation protein [Siminovitchia fortis]|uniref:Sporulation protein YtfJ n=1 Tax=Siminovitchia fortis TaxID=254758 RepID=A0A443INR3_9BACI|nr:GerW family sporulation protein [Siminovitchia fortis]RWR07751.1 sporulation protein YtfJ [Siminovitchia fortis]WHY83622.1 GerW family sporulation protein [Siminovitchia fortis]